MTVGDIQTRAWLVKKCRFSLKCPLPTLAPMWGQTSSSHHHQSLGPSGLCIYNKKSYTNTYIYIIYIKRSGQFLAAGLGASLCLRLLLLGCSVMLALVATSVFREMPVAEGASNTVQEAVGLEHPWANFSPPLRASVSPSVQGSPHSWALWRHALECRGLMWDVLRWWHWPWALGHLYLQVLVLVGVTGAIPSVVGAEAGAAHLAEKRGALLPPQPARDSCWGGGSSTALGGP